MTDGLVPKTFQWQPIPKTKLKGTMFETFDLTKDEDKSTEIDFGLLDEMFCRSKVEIEAEEAKKKAKEAQKAQSTAPKVRNVVAVKTVTYTAMKIASIRILAHDVVDGLFTLDNYAFKTEQASTLAEMIPVPEEI